MQKLNKVITKTFDFNTGEEVVKEIDLESRNAIIDENGDVLLANGNGFIKTTIDNIDIVK